MKSLSLSLPSQKYLIKHKEEKLYRWKIYQKLNSLPTRFQHIPKKNPDQEEIFIFMPRLMLTYSERTSLSLYFSLSKK
jgi:hypothetical protein